MSEYSYSVKEGRIVMKNKGFTLIELLAVIAIIAMVGNDYDTDSN